VVLVADQDRRGVLLSSVVHYFDLVFEGIRSGSGRIIVQVHVHVSVVLVFVVHARVMVFCRVRKFKRLLGDLVKV